MVAIEACEKGYTVEGLVKILNTLGEVPWNQNLVKELIWKPIQLPIIGHDKTSQLTTAEVNAVYQVVALNLAKHADISVPFPSRFG